MQFKNYLRNKYRVKKYLKKKFDLLNELFSKKTYLYTFPYDPFKKNNSELVPYLNYNAYQSNFYFLKKKFINRKYHKIISSLREKNSTSAIKKTLLVEKTEILKRYSVFNLIYTYNNLITNLYVDVFYKLNKSRKYRNKNSYYIVVSFPRNRMFINLLNFKKNNFFSLSSGLFIKFFEKKKSFKKNKTIKILMAKYLRKIFIMTKLKNITLISKNTPSSLIEFLTFLNTPIVHKFQDPLTNEIIEEKKNRTPLIKFLNLVFLKNIDFANNKSRSKGRVKRKILRKIISSNSIVD